MHEDGELIWWLSHGIEAPDGGLAMLGFAPALSDDQLWSLIDYLRANNLGAAMHATRRWPVPARAPEFRAECGDGHTRTLGELRGQTLLLVLGAHRSATPPGLRTILVTADPARPNGDVCVVREDDVARAYGIVAGLSSAETSGTQFLIDGQGWLRALQRGDAAPDWDDPAILAAAVAAIAKHPLDDAPPDHAGMKM